MSKESVAVPSGFSTVTPYVFVDDGDAFIDFCVRAFGAKETFRVRGEAGGMHAEIRIGDSPLMLGESSENYPFTKSALSLGGSPISLYLYLDDADAVYQRALLCGAEVVMPIEDNPDGDRRGGVRDPFGIIWWIATATNPNAREEMLEALSRGCVPCNLEACPSTSGIAVS
jgi:PhnB protein